MPERLTPHLQKVQEINSALVQTRNDFIGKYRRKEMGSTALTYEPALDRDVYKTLQQYNKEGSAYVHVKNNLNEYTKFQVETFIGERLHAGLSEFEYDLKNGALYGQGMSEPLLDMIKRGRECRDAVVQDIDKSRQDAEIVQFEKIQEAFTKPDEKGNLPPIGKTIVSMSPPGGPGSAYGKNFDDVFVLRVDEATGQQYIAASRFASGLSLEERKQRAVEINPDYFADYNGEPLDSYFLKNPLIIPNASVLSGDSEAVHKFLHKGHDFLSTEDFNKVRYAIAGMIVSYVNTLVETPENVDLLNLHLNAIMNKADNVVRDMHQAMVRGEVYKIVDHSQGPVRFAEISELGKQEVRQVVTGCGSSSGFGQENKTASNMSSVSLRDFGSDNYGNRTFNCPECGEMNVRPVNQLLEKCQHCESTEVAC